MTVGTKVKQALASLKSVQADFETFALETQDKEAKRLYADAARQTQEIVRRLEERVSAIEDEEPQYKGY